MKRVKRQKKEFWHKQMFFVNAGIFETDIGFIVNSTKPEAKKWIERMSGEKFKYFDLDQLEKFFEEESGDRALGRMIPFCGGFIVLLKADKDHFRKFVGLLSHEVTHVVQYLLRDRRIPLTEETEEIHAYLTEFLMKEVLYKLYD